MARRLNSKDTSFAADFEALLGPAKALLAAGASSYGRAGGE